MGGVEQSRRSRRRIGPLVFWYLYKLTRFLPSLLLRQIQRQSLFELRQRQWFCKEVLRAGCFKQGLSLSTDNGGHSNDRSSPGKCSSCFHCTYLLCCCDAILDRHRLVHQYCVYGGIVLHYLLDSFLAIICEQDLILQGCQHLFAELLVDLKSCVSEIYQRRHGEDRHTGLSSTKSITKSFAVAS